MTSETWVQQVGPELALEDLVIVTSSIAGHRGVNPRVAAKGRTGFGGFGTGAALPIGFGRPVLDCDAVWAAGATISDVKTRKKSHPKKKHTKTKKKPV